MATRVKVNVTKENLSSKNPVVAALKSAGFTGRIVVDGLGILAGKKGTRASKLVSLDIATSKQYQQVIDTVTGANSKPFSFSIKASSETLVAAGYQSASVGTAGEVSSSN